MPDATIWDLANLQQIQGGMQPLVQVAQDQKQLAGIQLADQMKRQADAEHLRQMRLNEMVLQKDKQGFEQVEKEKERHAANLRLGQQLLSNLWENSKNRDTQVQIAKEGYRRAELAQLGMEKRQAARDKSRTDDATRKELSGYGVFQGDESIDDFVRTGPEKARRNATASLAGIMAKVSDLEEEAETLAQKARVQKENEADRRARLDMGFAPLVTPPEKKKAAFETLKAEYYEKAPIAPEIISRMTAIKADLPVQHRLLEKSFARFDAIGGDFQELQNTFATRRDKTGKGGGGGGLWSQLGGGEGGLSSLGDMVGVGSGVTAPDASDAVNPTAGLQNPFGLSTSVSGATPAPAKDWVPGLLPSALGAVGATGKAAYNAVAPPVSALGQNLRWLWSGHARDEKLRDIFPVPNPGPAYQSLIGQSPGGPAAAPPAAALGAYQADERLPLQPGVPDMTPLLDGSAIDIGAPMAPAPAPAPVARNPWTRSYDASFRRGLTPEQAAQLAAQAALVGAPNVLPRYMTPNQLQVDSPYSMFLQDFPQRVPSPILSPTPSPYRYLGDPANPFQ